MSSIRNFDVSPTSSVKQGNRIVHPAYARILQRDQSPEVQSSEIISQDASEEDQDESERKDLAAWPSFQGKDNITEKNKNSSFEPKRFYRRKLAGFSQIRLFPVGKWLKFLRPPLQRRNSCPVIGISELEAEAQFHQSKMKNIEAANQVTQHSKQRSYRLSKWTSQEGFQGQKKEIPNSKSDAHSRDSESSVLSAVLSDQKNVNSSCISEEYEECELQNGESYSPLFQKTVIIVSESSTLTSNKICDSFDSDNLSHSEEININGISISMISRASLSENAAKQTVFPSLVAFKNNNAPLLKENMEQNVHATANSNSSQISQVKLNEVHCEIRSVKNRDSFNQQEYLKQNNASESTSFLAKGVYSQKAEIISIAPAKGKNINKTPDSVAPSFSTFKGDYQINPTVPNQTDKIQINKIRDIFPNKSKWTPPNSNYCDNFTLTSFNNRENTKAQNICSRRIYVPDDITKNFESDISEPDESSPNDNILLFSEHQHLFDRNLENQEVESDAKSQDSSHSVVKKKLCVDEDESNSERKNEARAQLIRITCSKSTTNGLTTSYQRNTDPKFENTVLSDPGLLNLGENNKKASFLDVQSPDINECYNVKLAAPEEVIVAGFHDFCHTMLSLEESIESGSGTVKRGKVKSEIAASKVQNNSQGVEVSKMFCNGQTTVSSQKMGIPYVVKCANDPNLQRSDNNALSSFLKDDIKSSKSPLKMNIKDPDVNDALTFLDESLKEVSDHLNVDGNDALDLESGNCKSDKRTLNVPKEDKVQCDNLIEEVLLEDASKRILNAYKKAPPPLPKRDLSHNFQMNSLSKPQSGSSEPKLARTEDVKNLDIRSISQNGRSATESEKDEENKFHRLPVPIIAGHPGMNDSCSISIAQDGNRSSPCSVDSGTSSHHQGYFVVIAIDFGTTYSGYAFSLTRDPDNIYMMKNWDGGDPGVCNQKSPTTILLTPEGKFHSFGFSARDYYHDLESEEARKWLYFEKFKMSLHNTEHLSLTTEIAAANGKLMPALTIFAHALRYFKEHALQELGDHTATRILNEDVRWVVTVPAIWKQPAKQFMRVAAYQAGIASAECPEQLLIALEPEAASIYCRKMKLHQLVPEETHPLRSFHWQKERDALQDADSVICEKGTQYMVVDCGGGTVDITVHELLDKQGALKELQTASGGPYGSIGVDIEFENFLCEIFGNDFMQQFKSTSPAGYIDLMTAFEARKRNANPYKNNSLNISLPFSFIECYKKFKGLSVESAVKKFSHKNIKWSQGMLRLEPSAMEALFKKTIKHIRKQIDDIISNKELSIEYIFLVGGFAESLILQKEMKEAFSRRVKVIIPQGISLAILKGAVLFGLDPTTVSIRRLRMTYGVGVLNHFVHGVHPTDKLVIKNGKQWCADVFDKFAVTNQSVGTGDVVVRRYTPAKDGQSCSVIHIYCSETDSAYFITDPGVKRCGTLILNLSDSRYIQSREIQTQMMFGDTEIKVSALDVTTGKCVKVEIDFLNH